MPKGVLINGNKGGIHFQLTFTEYEISTLMEIKNIVEGERNLVALLGLQVSRNHRYEVCLDFINELLVTHEQNKLLSKQEKEVQTKHDDQEYMNKKEMLDIALLRTLDPIEYERFMKEREEKEKDK